MPQESRDQIRMKRYLITSAITVTACLAMVAAAGAYASASTADVLTYGSVGGTNVAVNSVLTSTLRSGTSGTFFTTTNGTTGGSCSSGSLSAKVTSNPVAGGTADVSVTSQTFTNCRNNMSFSISSITVTTPYTATINQSGVRIANVSATIDGMHGLVATRCNYTGTSLSGTSVFTNQHFVAQPLSSSFCPSNMYYSATFNSFVDTSVTGNPTVYVNS